MECNFYQVFSNIYQHSQGHKVILSACSPYFKKILKDNPCRHPVLILNDIELEVLDALMTYMYHGTVSVPHNKLPLFLKTAEALKIKGIVDTTSDSGSDTSSLLSPSHQPGLLTIPQPLPLLPPPPLACGALGPQWLWMHTCTQCMCTLQVL